MRCRAVSGCAAPHFMPVFTVAAAAFAPGIVGAASEVDRTEPVDDKRAAQAGSPAGTAVLAPGLADHTADRAGCRASAAVAAGNKASVAAVAAALVATNYPCSSRNSSSRQNSPVLPPG